MRKLGYGIIALLLTLIAFVGHVHAASTVFVSQSGGSVSCGADGTQVTTALASVTWTAGNTYKLCGPLTSRVNVTAAGTASALITIQFETGASISGAACTSTTALLTVKSFMLVDLGAQVAITCPNNGTGLTNTNVTNGISNGCTAVNGGLGVDAGFTNVEIRNGTIGPLYKHTGTGNDGQNGNGICLYGGNNNHFHNLTITDVQHGISYGVGNGKTGGADEIGHNTFTNTGDSMLYEAGDSNGSSTGAFIHDNNVTVGLNWGNSAGNVTHIEALHIFTNGANSIFTGIEVYNNFTHGAWPAAGGTGCYFFEQGGTVGHNVGGKITAIIHDNICQLPSTGGAPGDGLFFAADPDLTLSYYNNLADCGANTHGIGFEGDVNANSTFKYVNNIVLNCEAAIYTNGTPTAATYAGSNNNIWSGIGSEGWGNVGSFATWKTACACDSVSSTAAPGLNADYTIASTGSLAHVLPGINLTSVGDTTLDTGAPQTFGVTGACGVNGCVARPSTGNWDVGPYPLVASNPTTPPLPIGFFSLDLFHTAYDTPGHFPTIPFGGIRPSDAGVSWVGIEPTQDTFSFTKLDTWIGLSVTNGQDLMLDLDRTPGWASGNTTAITDPTCTGCSSPPSDIASGNLLYKAFVTAVVQHSLASAKPIKYYSVWNEFDGAFWTGTPAQMVIMTNTAATTIHALDPNAIVVSPSISSCCTSGNGLPALTSFLNGGGGAHVDQISLHAYPSGTEPLFPDYILTQLVTVQALKVSNGIGTLPVIYTEGSYNGSVASSKTDPQKIAFEAQLYLNMRFNPTIPVTRFYWFQWDNVTFGTLWTSAGGLTVEGLAYQILEGWNVGSTTSTTAPCTGLGGTGLVTCSVTLANGNPAQFLWNNTTTGPVTVGTQFVQQSSLTSVTPTPIVGNSVTVGPMPIMVSAAQAVTFSPTSITFSGTAVGASSAPTTVTLTNSGTSNLVLSSAVTIAGANASSFSVNTGTCTSGATITAGANCTFAVTFSPTIAGALAANWTINDNAIGSPHTGTLTGTGQGGAGCAGATFCDTFNEGTLDTTKWQTNAFTQNNYAGAGSNFTSTGANCDLTTGMLRSTLTQPTASISTGCELQSKLSFGYGTYTWSIRASTTSTTPLGAGTTQSGQISTGFIIDGGTSITEIDSPEIEGQFPKQIEFTNWKNGANTGALLVQAAFNPQDAFHTYGFIWSPGKVQYFIDGVLVGTHTDVDVPNGATPGFVLISHYGTNSTNFGGLATVGVTRFQYCNLFRYDTPAPPIVPAPAPAAKMFASAVLTVKP